MQFVVDTLVTLILMIIVLELHLTQHHTQYKCSSVNLRYNTGSQRKLGCFRVLHLANITSVLYAGN